MAVIEIQAATLPGFPYYFPYRTGVRLTATPDALGGFYLPTDTDNSLVTGGFTGTATVLAPVDAATPVTATLSADSHVVHYIDATTATTATATVAVRQGQDIAAAHEITATADVIASRDKLITPDPTEITATASAVARLDGLVASTTPVIATLSSALTLDAVGSAEQGVFVLTDPEQLLDAAGSATTTIGTGRPGEVSQGQDLDSDALGLIALIAAEMNQASFGAAELAVDAPATGTLLRTLYLDTALDLTAGLVVTANNIAAALGITADFTAEVQHEQVAAAALEITADALADTYGTRFATGLVDLTADRSAVIKLDPGYQFYSDFTATLDATGLRTAYLQDVPTAVTAQSLADSSRTAPVTATVTVTVALTADSQVTRYAVADTAVSVIGFADSQRETYASADLTGLAVPTGTSLRTQYLDGPLGTTAGSGVPLVHLLGLMNTALAGEAQTTAAQQADLVASGELPVLATETALVSLAALAQASLELTTGFAALLTAALSGHAALGVLAHLPMLEALRVAYVEAVVLEAVGHLVLSEMTRGHMVGSLQLDLEAETDAMVMYRRYGGDPMWLPFFHAGYGKGTL